MVDSPPLVGVHREELAFRDQVISLFDDRKFDLMGISSGTSDTQTGTDDSFYYQAEHPRNYLQLSQQAKRHYSQIFVLHCGSAEQGVYAKVFCWDDRFISCMLDRLEEQDWLQQERVTEFIAELSPKDCGKGENYNLPQARTWITEKVWNDQSYGYLGIEVYLCHDDWASLRIEHSRNS